VLAGDQQNNRIAKIVSSVISTVFGNGATTGGDGAAATRASFNFPSAVAIDTNFNLYVGEKGGCVVRKVGGTISTVAGTGACGAGGGPGPTQTLLQAVNGVTIDSSLTFYLADTAISIVRHVFGNSIVPYAGSSSGGGYNGDNISATSAELNAPSGMAFDANNNLFIADRDNHRVRKVSSAGIITTVAGTGTPGSGGDNGMATSAQLNHPVAVAVDVNNNLYIADRDNQKVRKVTNGVITTFAGTGTAGFFGDNGMASAAQLNAPSGVAADANNVYISDTNNQRVRKVTGGIITSIAGNGTAGFNGEGNPATASEFNSPLGIAVDSQSNLYVADSMNNRVRQLTPNFTCTYGLNPTSGSVVAGASSNNTVTVTAPMGCLWSAASNSPGMLTITGGSSGNGNGTVTYSATANPKSGSLSGSLTIAGQTFNVTQAGQGCQAGFSPASASLGSGPGSTSVNVTMSGSDCQWTAASNAAFVMINSGGATGNGTVNYSVTSNAASSLSRSGSININVSTTNTTSAFNVTQAGSVCTYTLLQSGQSFGAAGGAGSASIMAPAGCGWSASSNESFAPITSSGTGSGNGTVGFTVQANSTPFGRSATLTIGGQMFGITQTASSNALSCSTTGPIATIVAAEGRTEKLGNLALNCVGMTQAITADIVLTLNTAITNNAASGPVVLTGSSALNGQLLGYSTVFWPAVTITPGGGIASLNISNLIADATQLPSGTTTINGTLSLRSNVAIPLINAQQPLATAAASLAFQLGQPNPPGGGAQTILPVSFQEAYATAFHSTAPATRFRSVLTNVPSTVQVYASVFPAGGAAQGQLYTADCSGAGGSPNPGVMIAGGQYAQLSVSGGVASATWVVFSANANAIDNFTPSFLLLNATAGDLAKITSGASGSYAPVSPAGIACGGADPSAAVVPRYRDFSVPHNVINLSLSRSSGASFVTDANGLPLVTVSRTISLANVSNGQTYTHPQITILGGNALTGTGGSLAASHSLAVSSGQRGCTASGSGTCTNQGDQTTCTWPSISSGNMESCTQTATDDPSSTSSGNDTDGASGDQDPGDPTQGQVSGGTPFPPTLQIVSPSFALTPPVITTPINITGWAIDQFTAIGGVQILVDGQVVGTTSNATYGAMPSPDPNTCNIYSVWFGCPNVGFTYPLNIYALSAGKHTITATAANTAASPLSSTYIPPGGLNSFMISTQVAMTASRVGVFRANTSFLVDSNGNGAYDPGVDRFIPTFTGPGGFKAGDFPVTGDWTGDGHAKVGIYRSSTGTWYLDANNDGALDTGDFTYSFGGASGDLPVVGDWTGIGKSCVGIFRSGFFWVLDLNCNGSFDGTNPGQDAAYPFGGISGDVPVVGSWTGGKKTRVGVVRKYAPAGVPQGNPFFWVVDLGDPDGPQTVASHQPDLPHCFPFGGVAGDQYFAGDWYGTGISVGGVYRSGLWVLDPAKPGDPIANHSVVGLFTFPFGGALGDLPVTGKW
jgi:hypothetical protein